MATNDYPLIGRWTLVLVSVLTIQVGFAPQFPVAGVVADLMLLIAVCAAVAGGPERGAIVGFWAGLLFDLARGGALGISALAFCLVAFAVGSLLVSVLDVRRGFLMLIVALGSAAGALGYAALGEMFGEHTLSNTRLWPIVGTIALVNGILALPALKLARWAEGPRDQPSPMMPVLDA